MELAGLLGKIGRRSFAVILQRKVQYGSNDFRVVAVLFCGSGKLFGLWFHEELAYQGEEDEGNGAEGKDGADAGGLGECSRD